jgi:DNA-binding CsgD family transcriptional regulator
VAVAVREGSVRPDKLVRFLEAAYDFEADDQAWLRGVMQAAMAAFDRACAMHGATFDASDIHALRMLDIHVEGFEEAGVKQIMEGRGLITPGLVARNFRQIAVKMSHSSLPEMRPMNDALAGLGYLDTLYLNGVDPGGEGVIIGLWCGDEGTPPAPVMAVYRRMAHHVTAAYRYRRRLRGSRGVAPSTDLTDGAAAVLDARNRVVHASAEAQTKEAQQELVESAKARDQALSARSKLQHELQRHRPLTSARWTLVDSFERSGARYVVARENAATVSGLSALSHREQQVVAFAAMGQSAKETAYALGISDTTVRVLLSRAARKLGVESRAQLLDHPEVRPLVPTAALSADPASPPRKPNGSRS